MTSDNLHDAIDDDDEFGENPRDDEGHAPTETTVKLSKPVLINGKKVKKLVFRKPLTMDVIAVGAVMEMRMEMSDSSDEGEACEEVTLSVNTKRLAKYICRIGKVPMNEVRRMALEDFSACQEALMPFLAGSGKGLSTDTADN